MSKSACIVFFLGLAIWDSPLIVYAHGTGYRTPQNKPVALEFYYSTGESMAYQEAKVYSPKDEKIAFQSGRTDEYGRFAFTPDVPGQWRIAVKDMEGHLSEATLDVPEIYFEDADGNVDNATGTNAVLATSAIPEGLDLYLRAGLGVSALLNVAAFAFLYRREKKVL